MDEPKDVDLAPHEWRSEREKPREPFFGPGAPGWLVWMVGLTITLTIGYWIRHGF